MRRCYTEGKYSLAMKALSFLILICVSTAFAQSAPPQAAAEKGDTVIAIFEDGGNLTLDDYHGLLQVHPKWQEISREQAIHEYALLRKAATLAQSQKLNEKSPYKESLDFTIMFAMAGFWANEATSAITVEPAEIEKYYNEHKEPYKQVKVSGIKVAFGGTAAPVDPTLLASKAPKKILTEEEAKAKAARLVAQIRGGADFAKLVQLESDDEASKAKGGELGTFRMTDNVPQDLRSAILGLNQGEISDPVRQAGGFYVVHADAVTYAPLAEVRDSIFDRLKEERARKLLQDFDKSVKVEFPAKPGQPSPAAPPDPKK
jgi:peptidyl-prolyl cis-trans isomerase C